MSDYMGNRQKTSTRGDRSVKLIAAPKQLKFDESVLNESSDETKDKLCEKVDADPVPNRRKNRDDMSSAEIREQAVVESNPEPKHTQANGLCPENTKKHNTSMDLDANASETNLVGSKLKIKEENSHHQVKFSMSEDDHSLVTSAAQQRQKTLDTKQINTVNLACEENNPTITMIYPKDISSTGNLLETQVNNKSSKTTQEQAKAAESDTVEKLVQWAERLTSVDSDLIEPLGSITRKIREHSSTSGRSDLYIAILIKHDFSEKFEKYLTRHGIYTISELEKVGKAKQYWPTVKRFLMLVWIACDLSVNFCQYILSSSLFHILLKDLQGLCFLKYADSDLKTFTVKAILGILHNICRHLPNGKWKLRNDGVVSVVRLYLQSEVSMIRLKAFIILSYIISEAENEMINSDDDNFVFIFKVLDDALQAESHKSNKYGMSVVEVMKGLNNLAINDENKIRIVRNGGLPLFQVILESGGPDEIRVTITTLWSLAFHHYNKVKMREMPSITSKLYELQLSRDEEICHAARGTFWELENVSKASIGSSMSSSLSTDKDPSQPHIMISYQWDSQAVMMKVKDRLRQAGYKVWMDIEHMTGSTLEAMALAVEKAAVVLICMSQKYKDSPNCRTEAEYVYRLRKDFVPLRLQKEYIPDGWLGILVGTRLYFDIYSEDHLDDQVPRLTRELRDRGKINPTVDQPYKLPIIPQRLTSREAVPILHHPVSPTVSNWTTQDVKKWINSVGLTELTKSFEQIDGPVLLELQKIQESAPEYFHSLLRKDFNIPVVPALKLSRYLRQLT